MNWNPVVLPDFVLVGEEWVRAGTADSICRPGMERWPLGHVSSRYRLASHLATVASIGEFCGDLVRPSARLICGHGYRVVHGYDVRHQKAAEVAGNPVRSRLMIVNGHTGNDALRASVVAYVGDCAIGSISSSRGLHVSSNAAAWHQDVNALIERALWSQDALLDLLRAADERAMSDADRKFFADRDMIVAKDDGTALRACMSWIRGRTKKVSWGTWERRLDDEAIRALVVLLGRNTFGKALDDAMTPGSKNYQVAR